MALFRAESQKLKWADQRIGVTSCYTLNFDIFVATATQRYQKGTKSFILGLQAPQFYPKVRHKTANFQLRVILSIATEWAGMKFWAMKWFQNCSYYNLEVMRTKIRPLIEDASIVVRAVCHMLTSLNTWP